MKRAKSVEDVVGFIRNVMKLRSSMMFRVGKCNLTIGNYFGHKNQIDLNGVWLEARDRGQGEATKALQLFTEACDVLKVSVILEAQPMVKTMDFSSLVRLYTRHGLVKSTKHSDTNHFMMLRKPQKPHTKKGATVKKSNAIAANMSLKELARATGGVLVTASHDPEDIFTEAMNAFYAYVQKAVGQKHGDLAGHHFNANEDDLRKYLLPYIKLEIKESGK